MLTVSGRLLKVQSRNLPAARNFSSGLKAIFMQRAPDPCAAPDGKGGPLAPFEPGWQTFDVARQHPGETPCEAVRPQEKWWADQAGSMRNRARRSPAAAARRIGGASGTFGRSGSGREGGTASGPRPATGGIGLGGSFTGPSTTVPRGRRNGDALIGATTFLPNSVVPSRGGGLSGTGAGSGRGSPLAGADADAGLAGRGAPTRPAARGAPAAREPVFTGVAAASEAVT